MRALLARDFERFRRELPPDFAAHVRDAYHVDLSARYLGLDLPHPIGKGSGQLSLNAGQLERDAAAGLAYVVLKTVIAQDESGARAMGAWAIPESKMTVERRAAADGREGWTVTWKGRGWDRSFDDYLALVRAGRDLTRASGMPVVPSVKYHLPRLGEEFRDAEYAFTTQALARAWGDGALLVEHDFSPTLAGDALADEREQILRWIREVPERIRGGKGGQGERVKVALKLMNARFDDDFQGSMLAAAAESGADALVVFNRLFDGERGVAYGGWDLSDRNLRVLDQSRLPVRPRPSGSPLGSDRPTVRQSSDRPTAQLAGTGNVCSGRVILDYARCGCESVQLHTFFQIPLDQYPATAGSRTQRALHALIFHPVDGLVAGLLDAADAGEIEPRGGMLHFLDYVDAHRGR